MGLTIEGLGAYSEGIESLLEMDLGLTIKGLLTQKRLRAYKKVLFLHCQMAEGGHPWKDGTKDKMQKLHIISCFLRIQKQKHKTILFYRVCFILLM